MKTFTTLTCTVFLLLGCFLQAQTVNIPDQHFLNDLILQGVDANGDGQIQVSEALTTTRLNLFHGQTPDERIDDLTGIGAFINLTYLNAGYNNLTIIDLSQNIALDTLLLNNNPLTFLDITENHAINYLRCSEDELTDLIIGQNTSLKRLQCWGNKLISLDVSQNPNLEKLKCYDNQIESLDLSQNASIKWAYLENNNLSYLDIQNGNYQNITIFGAANNPNLTCIFVDNKEYWQNHWGEAIDSVSHFVETQEECDNLGVESYKFQKLKVYPNPVHTKLHIRAERQPIGQIVLFNLRGKKLISKFPSQSFQILDLSLFPSGIYFLRIISPDYILTKKIIKL